jgi:natural product biosynthesis luciferase-like monooxygenase protein
MDLTDTRTAFVAEGTRSSDDSASVAPTSVDMPLGHMAGKLANAGDVVVAAFAAFLSRVTDRQLFDLGLSEPELRRQVASIEGVFAAHVPLRVELAQDTTLAAALETVYAQLATTRQHGTYMLDLVARTAQAGAVHLPIIVELVEPASLADFHLPATADLCLAVATDGSACRWLFREPVYTRTRVEGMRTQFGQLLTSVLAGGELKLREVQLLDDDMLRTLLVDWNDTAREYPRDACIHHLFEEQVDRTPAATAAVFQGESITYAELDRRANQVARHLRGVGVDPDTLVGICLERSIDLLVALLGVHKAGGAYVPLDPAFPNERLELMVEDARLQVLVTQRSLQGKISSGATPVVVLDAERETLDRLPDTRLADVGTQPDHLAYVIYTSGSTGKPKGVMVEHRNAVNFFAGMDERLDHSTADDPRQRVWMAVTSLSFDISVLELFWTLTRGFKVVIHSDSNIDTQSQLSSKPIQFSLFYFASDEGESVQDKYRLLLDGARFADEHGFSAVWTPERHFHAFGGLYPNPAVTSAAIAASTRNIQIRAGSVVLPLHSPIRVAEEWSLVDNLSGGRVGISFASGWQPNDFALQPSAFADRKELMYSQIETVRALWRGEEVTFPGPKGDVRVKTLPRPVQRELPFWITAAGTPDTYEQAGRLGAGVLTHLLGQTVEELADKLARYRAAWQEAGHAGEGHVTLMLHTFVGDDEAAVHETVRQPMKEYLRSSVDLIRKAAWSFPAFATQAEVTGKSAGEIFDSEQQHLTDEEMDALLDHAFERYYRTSGLFGTPESCLATIEKLKSLNVDEVACLIDFGVDSAMALEHLEHLNTLKEQSNAAPLQDYGFGAQMQRHDVTHLQCTPSMAGMLLLDDQARNSLRPLTNMMVGGEAFPVVLAKQLRELVSGAVVNMYGPTETTIWSATHELGDVSGASIPIGRPIANTQLYILDSAGQPQPIGVPGELFIGGDGVTRGYLNRPELTSERFVADPFNQTPGTRMYRTGDLARLQADGTVEFLGRIDHQVKIRGYRIELGEIETLINEHPAVREAVVIAREDVPGDKRLVGYVIPKSDAAFAADELKAHLRAKLPDYMVPSHIVTLDRFPLTPNAKVDRKALPAPDETATDASASQTFAAPQGDLEAAIAEIWREVLRVPSVSVTDNFFDLGGHSLLMVQVHHKVRGVLQREMSITDLFRFPTVRLLAEHVGRMDGDADEGTALQEESDKRASARKEFMQRRRLQKQSANA